MDTVIYLPKTWGDGEYNKYGFPRLIYVFRYRKGNPIGSAHQEEAEAGRGSEYPANRCLPFTDWDVCQQHIQKRIELDNEYKDLLKLARRSKLRE